MKNIDKQMKSILLLMLALTQISVHGQTTDGFTFRVQYKPETTYTQTLEQSSHSDIKYSGSKEFLQMLKNKGVQNPAVTDKISSTESVVKTGKVTDGDQYPLTIEFVKSTSSDGKNIIPNGTVIYGRGTTRAMPTLDSIASSGLSDDYKKTLLQAMRSTFSQLSFPEKKVKVGESFSIESPLTIPVAGVTIEMTITTTYTLLSVTNGIADIDVTQAYKMKTNVSKYTVSASGSGKGKMLYDDSIGTMIKYTMNTEMTADVKLEQFDLSIRSSNGFTQTTKVK